MDDIGVELEQAGRRPEAAVLTYGVVTDDSPLTVTVAPAPSTATVERQRAPPAVAAVTT